MLVREILQLVQHLRSTNRFTIELQLKATRMVEINQQELQQVMVNLLVNAVHALPEQNGNILITTRDWESRGVAIDIKDNGTGIDEEKLGRIFNPFYSTKGQGEGSGLGLSVSYGLIRRYGGNITVKSTAGTGSEFTVWLLQEPVLIEDEKPSPNNCMPWRPMRRHKVY